MICQPECEEWGTPPPVAVPLPLVKTHHKKARIRRKYEKKNLRINKFLASLIRPLYPRFLVCKKCGRTKSIYRALADSLVKVQPMGPGAIPYYWGS